MRIYYIIISLMAFALSGCIFKEELKDEDFAKALDPIVQVHDWGMRLAMDTIKCAQTTLLPHSDQIHSAGWTYSNNKIIPLPPLYCYQTIGGVNCFTHPRPGRGWQRQIPSPDVHAEGFPQFPTESAQKTMNAARQG